MAQTLTRHPHQTVNRLVSAFNLISYLNRFSYSVASIVLETSGSLVADKSLSRDTDD